MTTLAPTTIYSASAGSGKTYQLTRSYLRLLLSHPHQAYHRRILAVTFTNKAVAEMKTRILETLKGFAEGENSYLFNDLATELSITGEEIEERSRTVLRRVLHDYSAFDVVTIDSFNHRLLRTFSKELGLDANFEVDLDTERLLTRAIDNLLTRAGSDEELTEVLVDFSLSKIDQDKSWDIRYDLAEIAKLITSENHYRQLKAFQKMEGGEFVRFRESVEKDFDKKSKALIKTAHSLTTKADSLDLEKQQFAGGARGFWNLVEKVAGGDLSSAPDKKYLALGPDDKLHAGKATKAQIEQIETLRTDILAFLNGYKQSVGEVMFLENLRKQLTPLSVLAAIVQEIEAIKKEDRILPIFEFNGLLSEKISGEPAPFLYERLGERYQHYFIDEFQDTSVMQWQNLQPLISNAIDSLKQGKAGSLMLVGDAKQSIYRWRGGEPDQFVKLLTAEDLFHQRVQQEVLESNWRSYSTIVEFNNQFFTDYAKHLRHPAYAQLYADYLKQELTGKEGGFVQLGFIEPEKGMSADDKRELHLEKTLAAVRQAGDTGFQTGEICILTRNNKDGLAVTSMLAENGMPVVSGEALLVSSAPEVRLLAELLRWMSKPEMKETQAAFLSRYAQYHQIADMHGFLSRQLGQDINEVFQQLFNVDYKDSYYPTLYETVEVMGNKLGVLTQSDARLREFLEYVRDFSISQGASLQEWLSDWDIQQDKLSVSASAEGDAIQVMTIHKAKGLEFPVVITPFIDNKKLDATGPGADLQWFEASENSPYKQPELLLAAKKEMVFYPEPITEQYDLYLQKAEMDNVNVLYVALTRAVEQLYLISDQPGNHVSAASLLLAHAESYMQQEEEWTFTSGQTLRQSKPESIVPSEIMERYENNQGRLQQFALNQGALWAGDNDAELEWGNLVHWAMSHIETREDFFRFRESSQSQTQRLAINYHQEIPDHQIEQLLETVEHIMSLQELQPYFEPGLSIQMEKRIRGMDGSTYVPDRIVHLNRGVVAILDYKTGLPEKKHHQQIRHYADLMCEMGYEVKEMILVYTDSYKVEKVA